MLSLPRDHGQIQIPQNDVLVSLEDGGIHRMMGVIGGPVPDPDSWIPRFEPQLSKALIVFGCKIRPWSVANSKSDFLE